MVLSITLDHCLAFLWKPLAALRPPLSGYYHVLSPHTNHPAALDVWLSAHSSPRQANTTQGGLRTSTCQGTQTPGSWAPFLLRLQERPPCYLSDHSQSCILNLVIPEIELLPKSPIKTGIPFSKENHLFSQLTCLRNPL